MFEIEISGSRDDQVVFVDDRSGFGFAVNVTSLSTRLLTKIGLCKQSIQASGFEVDDGALTSHFDAVTRRVWSKPF